MAMDISNPPPLKKKHQKTRVTILLWRDWNERDLYASDGQRAESGEMESGKKKCRP